MIKIDFDSETKALIEAIKSTYFAEYMDAAIENAHHEAGGILLDSIHNVLGQSDLLTLHPLYSERKKENPYLFRVAGKAPDQPLIFSGVLYNSFVVSVDIDGAHISFVPVATRLLPHLFYYKGLSQEDFEAKYFKRNTGDRVSRPRNTGSDYRKPRPTQTNSANTEAYAQHWENETHFMEKAIHDCSEAILACFVKHTTAAIEGYLYHSFDNAYRPTNRTEIF